MDYVYEVDLANGKTVKVTHREKTYNPFLFVSDGKQIEGTGISKTLGAYTAEELIAKMKQKDTFLASDGNHYASDKIISARLLK
jgi:hypothetical protein